MNKILPIPGTDEPLNIWLDWLETIHPVAIDMGLERVSGVADRLGLRPISVPLILVAGTNGKGSTVAMLSSIYHEAGYRVGAYTSPHIDHFCERIRINGDMVDEKAVVNALSFIENGREPQSLTYFEYTTLAAMRLFLLAECDVVVLEVGLGGRLDATNCWDADCSIVTSIALDHQEYLGSDIGVIATEKAAIGRSGKPLIVGEPHPPSTLFAFSETMGYELVEIGKQPLQSLPDTNLAGAHQRRNAASAVAAVHALHDRLPVTQDAINKALMDLSVDARFEKTVIEGITVIMDVAHNPASARALRETWSDKYSATSCDIIFAALADKDIGGIVRELSPVVASWQCLELSVARAASAEHLAEVVQSHCPDALVQVHDNALSAWQSASDNARSDSRPVMIAGSFHTITAVRDLLRGRTTGSCSSTDLASANGASASRQ